jgi:hypothetical protein
MAVKPLVTAPSRSRRWEPATSPPLPGCASNRSSSASPSPLGWACPRPWSGDPGLAHSWRTTTTPARHRVSRASRDVTCWRARDRSSPHQAGLVNNLNMPARWDCSLLLPSTAHRQPDRRPRRLYPAVGVWDNSRRLRSDRAGRTPHRRGLSCRLAHVRPTYFACRGRRPSPLGAGTGSAPTLLVSSAITPTRVRATAVGTYRFWRDWTRRRAILQPADHYGIPTAVIAHPHRGPPAASRRRSDAVPASARPGWLRRTRL